MKRFILAALLVVAVFSYSYYVVKAQSDAGIIGQFFNTSGQTILKGQFVKPDSGWIQLGTGMDTTQYVHQWTDTSASGTGYANCSTYVGSTQLKGIIDTLAMEPGNKNPFDVKFVPVTASSTDSIFVYGWAAVNAWRGGDSSAVIDTVIWAGTSTTERLSPKAWKKLDSIRIRTANTGLDSIEIWYKSPRSITLSDSFGQFSLGVCVGARMSTTGDTIADDAWGYIATSGIADAWANGGSRGIKVGDLLMVGTDSKVERVYGPVQDTVRTVGSTAKRYVQGVRLNDVVNVTALRISGEMAGDTLLWSAKAKNDTIYFVANTINASVAVPAAYADSLTYEWIPRGMFGFPQASVIVGRALLPAQKDSVLIPVKLW